MSAFIDRSKGFFDSIGDRLQGVNLRQNGIFLALIALVLFFAATTPNAASITPTNFSNLVVQNGYILVLAIGMVMVIIAGHIDLSVGSVAAFIGGVAGILTVRPLEQDGWEWLPALPWWAGIIGAILVGALTGGQLRDGRFHHCECDLRGPGSGPRARVFERSTGPADAVSL